MGQPKPNSVKKSKCKVSGLKPELKNDMVKKKPAFHWNKPPKPDLVKTTFFEAKREEFREFEILGSDSPIPGLQIADFTVSRARVRGRSRKVSLDENSLLGASSVDLCTSKSAPSASSLDFDFSKPDPSATSVDLGTSQPAVSISPIDLCNSSQSIETYANNAI